MSLFKRNITKDQSRDTGMAMVLIFLIAAASRKKEGYLFVAMALHVVNMIVPQVYKPLGYLWFGLSDLLSMVVSKIMLSIVFFGVVTPIAILRRLSGKDSLKLRAFKGGKDSVMVERNHSFIGKDLESPY